MTPPPFPAPPAKRQAQGDWAVELFEKLRHTYSQELNCELSKRDTWEVFSQALRQARRNALEEAAKVAETTLHQLVIKESVYYFGQRDAVLLVVKRIRALMAKEKDG